MLDSCQMARKMRREIFNNKRSVAVLHHGKGKYRSTWDFGHPGDTCVKYGAQMWFEERNSKKGDNSVGTSFRLCCSNGRVKLPHMKQPPELLEYLLTNRQDKCCTDFRNNIRIYNSMFTFKSMGGHIDNTVNSRGHGPYVFRLNGQNHHHIGNLLPSEGNPPRFAQLYFYDTENEVSNRIGAVVGGNSNNQADIETVKNLLQMLDECNPLVQTFRMARDRFQDVEVENVTIQLISRRGADSHLYNEPSCSEVAAVIVGDFGLNCNGRDILVEYKNSGVNRIPEDHPSFMALQYPLLFPYGEDGFVTSIEYHKIEGEHSIKRKCVTMREYYAYRIQRRRSEGNTMFLGGKRFQQFIVDAYTCIENTRINWIRANQRSLRVELYKGLGDAVYEGDTDAANVEKRVILLSSFTGGRRYMVQNYQDAMAICRWAGYPELFITFTCNPKWSEIKKGMENLEGHTSVDGPDIIARVFKIKLDSLMHDLIHQKHFGRIKAGLLRCLDG